MQPVTDGYLQFRSENFKENKRMEELSWLKWKFNCCFLQLKKIWHLENLFWDTLYNIFSSYYPELVYATRARHAKFIHDTMSLKPMNAGSICTRWYLFIWYSHMSYDVFFLLTMHVPRAAWHERFLENYTQVCSWYFQYFFIMFIHFSRTASIIFKYPCILDHLNVMFSNFHMLTSLAHAQHPNHITL